jgi:hypothetical protein
MTEKKIENQSKAKKFETHIFEGENINPVQKELMFDPNILELLPSELSEKWHESNDIVQTIIKNISETYGVKIKKFEPIITDYLGQHAAFQINSGTKEVYVLAHISLLAYPKQHIVYNLVHEILGHAILSKNSSKKSDDLIVIESGVHITKNTTNESRNIGESLNEGIVDYIARTEVKNFFGDQSEAILENNYDNLVEKIDKLNVLFTPKPHGYVDDFYSMLIKTLRSSSPRLIIKYVYETTGVKINPKKLLNMEIDEYIEQIREVFEKRKTQT